VKSRKKQYKENETWLFKALYNILMVIKYSVDFNQDATEPFMG
jgi:hypothetical protein